jgi:hypothetical protein
MKSNVNLCTVGLSFGTVGRGGVFERGKKRGRRRRTEID